MRAGAKQDWFGASHRGHKSPRDGRMKDGSCISAHTADFYFAESSSVLVIVFADEAKSSHAGARLPPYFAE